MIAPTYLLCSNYSLKIETALWKYYFQSFKINITFILRFLFFLQNLSSVKDKYFFFFSVWKVFKITFGIIFHTIADSLKQNINFWLSEGISFLRVAYFQAFMSWDSCAWPLFPFLVAPQWRSQPSYSRVGDTDSITTSLLLFVTFASL